ncbi:MAG: hypothetical protein AAB630_00710 [Patescibacteria group bacterium]
MKASVVFSFQNGKALSIELIPENKGDRDFLAVTIENMEKTELAARILSHIETNAGVKSVTFSLNVPQEISMPEDEIDAPPPVPKKSYLC